MNFTHRVHKLVFLMDKMADQALLQQLDLTFSQFLILMGIQNNPAVSQKDIARFLDVTEAAVSRQIEVLHQQGFVQRKENTKNRREHILTITDTGKEKFFHALHLLDGKFDNLYRVLTTTQQTQFATCIDKLLDNIDTQGKTIECKGKTCPQADKAMVADLGTQK